MATPVLRDSDTEKCIINCLNGARSCFETLHHCLSQKRTLIQGKEISLLQMCAETCTLSSRMMISDLEFHHQACELCFEVCEACAEMCERYVEDPIMAKCAQVCRRCAESCRGMAGMTVRISEEQQEGFASRPM